jgi:predicted metal-dependent hydrolase
MAQKIVDLPGIGEVLLAKRRGTRSLRLTIQPNGQVRVGLPAWLPYSAAITFALSRTDWINQNLQTHRLITLRDGSLIGKSYRLQFISVSTARRTATRLGQNVITVTTQLEISDAAVQNAATRACERALKKEASNLLPQRLDKIARQYGFVYKDARIKRLRSRWGSCSTDGLITLNYYLVQLPWHLIDYVLLHELIHTRALNHGHEFWGLFEQHLPNAKALRSEIRQYRPTLMPS